MKRLAGLLALVLLAVSCGESRDDDALSKTALTRLETTDIKVGAGTEARPGRRVSVHYTGWLYHPAKPDHKGRKFDSSRDRGKPFDVTLGQGEVIAGWDEGLVGMKVGGERRLVIPPAMAYGSSGQGDIPPGATLVFDIELMGVQ